LSVHLVGGHDPEVMRIYPAVPNGLGVGTASLHLPPSDAPRLPRG